MRKRSVLLATAAAVGAFVLPGLAAPAVAAPPPEVSPLIVGGHDATEEYSFVVSLQQQGQHACGGSLIAEDRVVTAAHCVGGSGYTVRVGSNDHTSGGEEAGVASIRTHPTGDIAVLTLDRPVSATPIPIADDSGDPGTATRIIGWGQTCAEPGCGPAPRTLQELDTQVVPDADCLGIDGANEICTDNPGGDSGACYGDSGGPQIKGTPGNWELIGATSRAGNENPTCATGPSIYADVVAYADWIRTAA
ncbi:serine protease [Saccharopolyspora cebuensis]|uniref:Serine protease n=1 Tax=Saccharopolyspora cebuensis TaxID=418759 RepID=A0ABV4CM29_9PSEU